MEPENNFASLPGAVMERMDANKIFKEDCKMETVRQLEKKVQEIIKELETLPTGEEREAKVAELVKLCGALKEIKSVEYAEEDNYRNYGIAVERMQNDKIDKIIGHALAAAGLSLSVLMGYWTFRFDEKGTITSTLGRNIMNKFIPKK